MEKDSSIVPSLFFSPFFIWALWPLSISLSLLFVWATLASSFFPHMGKCSSNDDHHTFIYSQLEDHNDDDSIGNVFGSVPGCATI